jgi:F0F1-type ATP synthase membrane subunit b/b'
MFNSIYKMVAGIVAFVVFVYLVFTYFLKPLFGF